MKWRTKSFCYRSLVFLLAVFVLGMTSGSRVLALYDERMHNYDQNDIFFYDPDCIDYKGSKKRSLDDLYFIFDIDGTLDTTASYTEPEEIYDGVVAAFQWMESNGVTYKIMTARSGNKYEKGKEWVQSEILDKIGTSKTADEIFYPHTSAGQKAKKAAADGATIVFEDKKSTVKQVVKKGMKAVNVILPSGSNKVEGDGIYHLNASYANFVSVVESIIADLEAEGTDDEDSDDDDDDDGELPYCVYDPCSGSGGSGGGGDLTGSTRAEKIWNYIAGLGISGLSDKAEAIAGVVGNMATETGGTFNPFVQNSSGCTGLIQWCTGSWNDGFFSYMASKGLDSYYYKGSEPDIDESIIDEGIDAELDFLFKGGSGGVTAANYISNLGVPSSKNGTDGAKAYAELFLVTVENAYGGSEGLNDDGVKSIASHSTYQGASSRRNHAVMFYDNFKESVGSGEDYDDDDDAVYCEPDYSDEEDDYEGTSCEDTGTCDEYTFPLLGATKSNYMHGSSLSPLVCTNLSKGGCHHDYFAMDLGIDAGTKTAEDYPDLMGKYSDDFWRSVGVKVVAMYSGKITSYKPYSRAKEGYKNRCASVTFVTDDGRKFWLGHMLYDSSKKAGDTFTTGQVIGEVGPPPCAINTQAHLHVDETLNYGSSGTVETVKLINTLYEKLP